MKRALLILAATALALCVTFGVYAYLDARRAAARKADRIARLESFGIVSDGTEEFFPLPPVIPVDQASAELGGNLFRDRRLTAPKGRTCLSCHPLNTGGIDGKRHGGLLTRPVPNATFTDIFLHDGSVTGLTALVERMVCDPRFGGATNIGYSAAWIGSDIKFAYKFKKRYPDGVTVTNMLDALTAYIKTRVTSNGPFDRYCAGHKDALSKEQVRGLEVFRAQKCTDCHDGPVLGAWKIADERKVPALRGLSTRKVYSAAGPRSDLSSVLPFMPGGDIESSADRVALLAFLGCL